MPVHTVGRTLCCLYLTHNFQSKKLPRIYTMWCKCNSSTMTNFTHKINDNLLCESCTWHPALQRHKAYFPVREIHLPYFNFKLRHWHWQIWPSTKDIELDHFANICFNHNHKTPGDQFTFSTQTLCFAPCTLQFWRNVTFLFSWTCAKRGIGRSR